MKGHLTNYILLIVAPLCDHIPFPIKKKKRKKKICQYKIKFPLVNEKQSRSKSWEA